MGSEHDLRSKARGTQGGTLRPYYKYSLWPHSVSHISHLLSFLPPRAILSPYQFTPPSVDILIHLLVIISIYASKEARRGEGERKYLDQETQSQLVFTDTLYEWYDLMVLFQFPFPALRPDLMTLCAALYVLSSQNMLSLTTSTRHLQPNLNLGSQWSCFALFKINPTQYIGTFGLNVRSDAQSRFLLDL